MVNRISIVLASAFLRPLLMYGTCQHKFSDPAYPPADSIQWRTRDLCVMKQRLPVTYFGKLEDYLCISLNQNIKIQNTIFSSYFA